MEIAMVEKNAPEGQQQPFKNGDKVLNVNPTSLCYNRVGTFRRYWSDKYYFYRGRGCDVEYPGVKDLYGRVETAQSVADLERVE